MRNLLFCVFIALTFSSNASDPKKTLVDMILQQADSAQFKESMSCLGVPEEKTRKLYKRHAHKCHAKLKHLSIDRFMAEIAMCMDSLRNELGIGEEAASRCKGEGENSDSAAQLNEQKMLELEQELDALYELPKLSTSQKARLEEVISELEALAKRQMHLEEQ